MFITTQGSTLWIPVFTFDTLRYGDNHISWYLTCLNVYTIYKGIWWYDICARQKYVPLKRISSPIARFMGPTWGPSGADRTQVGPMMAPWTLLFGMPLSTGIYCILCWYIISVTLSWSNKDFISYYVILLRVSSPWLPQYKLISTNCPRQPMINHLFARSISDNYNETVWIITSLV